MFLVNRRLAIVVPYRDRAEHLQALIAHLDAYFSRDKIDQNIDHQIYIIEQGNSQLFNRGKLRNIGFSLLQAQFDYFAFHDVDYLPIWSDYSYPEQPTQLVYYGTVLQEPEDFFGGVVLFQKKHFQRVNGYSNEYWGWGFEDCDLRLRCVHAGLFPMRRKGTYQSLSHAHQGYLEQRQLTPESYQNLQRYRNLQQDFYYQNDGLNTLNFSIIKQVKISEKCFQITVDLGSPDPERNINKKPVSTPSFIPSNSQRIAVLGLYNSGSTAIATILHHLGIHMGEPFWLSQERNFYEPYDLGCQLQRWWNEPNLRENTPPEIRVQCLKNWILAHEHLSGKMVGAKHPLLSLCGQDLQTAWGDNIKFIWSYRDLETSIKQLQKRNWFGAYTESLQKTLWAALNIFFETQSHLKIVHEDLLSDPTGTVMRMIQYLQINPSELAIQQAIASVKKPQ